MSTEGIKWMKVSDLAFDRKNPRLSEYDFGAGSTEVELIQFLWDAMDVRELVMSIAASGFFPHEPIVIVYEDGKNIVIEGNRRLAAVKLLLDPGLAQTLKLDIPDITDKDRDALTELPTVSDTRKNAWRYLGFKHVNGPAKWSSYAKSTYIANVHKEFAVSLEDIAKQIGDTHRTVQRLFQGLMVIEQAERMRVFSRDDRWHQHFSFSHLYTGIGYDGIGNFIGLRLENEEINEPVPVEKKDELGELCLWMYGSRRERKPPVIGTQNPHLRYLDAVVSNKEAIAALRSGHDIYFAYEISRPPSNVFEQSLNDSKRELQKARGLHSTGYDGSEGLLRIARDVVNLAHDLYDDMKRKRDDTPRQRIEEPV
jgi:hypothetical protein